MSSLSSLAILLALSGTASALQCNSGDAVCFCKKAGGQWKQGKPPMIPTCRIYYEYQGRQRWAHVYFPVGYDGSRKFPMWVHLHGVFWNTMANIGEKLGAIDATDIIPYWDKAIKMYGDKAVIVYPQSTGRAGTGSKQADTDPVKGPKYRQFWNIPFWHCSVGVCSDQSVDDIGCLEMIIADMHGRLAINSKQVLLSGESAGGMMVQTLLCQSKKIPKAITGAVDILGGIGKDYALGPLCKQSQPVAFMKIHGMTDPFITWDKDILVDGVNFISAVGGAQLRAAHNGCQANQAGPWYTDTTGKMTCKDLCRNKYGAKRVKVCGLNNVAHDTDHPWPGFVYQQTWKFFSSILASRAAAAKAAAAAARVERGEAP